MRCRVCYAVFMYRYHGLRGAPRIVFEEICRLVVSGKPVSVTRLAGETGYDRRTVSRALAKLRKAGLVEIVQAKRGSRAEYRVKGGMVSMSEALDLLNALKNAITMSAEERAKRFAMAQAAARIYDDALALSVAAGELGDEQFAGEVEEYLSRTGALDRYQVWPLDEAVEIQARITDMLSTARARLGEEE